MSTSFFADVPLAPRDPILGLNEAFQQDARSNKVNLGVGVYFDDNGKLPVLAAVAQAEQQRASQISPRGYLPIEGIATYNQAVQELLFGKDAVLLAEKRVVTCESLGGTGALKLGADFLKQISPNGKVLISDPSWENHRALFETAGYTVESYPYYDASNHGVKFDAMINHLNQASQGTIIVLHACCHNPTGVDLNAQQWQAIIEVVQSRQLIPFLDIAYQGFGDGIQEDALAVRLFAQANVNFLVASSFSKSFSLYGERVGALSLITNNSDESSRVLSQIKRVIRTNYSNPPTHGATIVANVLTQPELRQLWENELGQMRVRIKQMREQLVDAIKAAGCPHNFEFVKQQRGMFSYSGLTSAQVDQLRETYGIYAVGTGRICVAALNSKNLPYVADAIAKILAN